MRIAIIGSGGREHAISWKLSQNIDQDNIYVIPGNGGIKNSINLNINNFNVIKNFCLEDEIELIIVGPEQPLANGIAEYFKDSEVKVFGPTQNAARLESSKIWAKNFMKKYDVATSQFWTFNKLEQADTIINELNGQLVVKYDGLAAGKGVYVCSNIEEAHNALKDLEKKYGSEINFLIEKRLYGKELSIIGITDGKSIKLLSSSQDHKQLCDGDKGPNTGGMGAYCPVGFLDDNLLKSIKLNIINPTLEGIKQENMDYIGFIYFGLMITDNGSKLLEYNVRLGDPEAEVILPALKSDLSEIIKSCYDGTLEDFNVEFSNEYYVDVVLTSGGYPETYKTGYEISGLDKIDNDIIVFHSGTKYEKGKIITSGGRVLNIVGHNIELKSAIERVYKEIKKVSFENMYYRTDIGKRGEL